MPAIIITRNSLDAREPGNIQVTPIPIEVPIHSRPVLHSSESSHTNATFRYSAVDHAPSDGFHWGLLILMILLILSFALIMSKWGWNKITGQLWKLSSGWPGSVENMEDEEELLPSPEVTVLEMHEIQSGSSPLARSAEETVRDEQSEVLGNKSEEVDIYG